MSSNVEHCLSLDWVQFVVEMGWADKRNNIICFCQLKVGEYNRSSSFFTFWLFKMEVWAWWTLVDRLGALIIKGCQTLQACIDIKWYRRVCFYDKLWSGRKKDDKMFLHLLINCFSTSQIWVAKKKTLSKDKCSTQLFSTDYQIKNLLM